jgi:hypothetical protein
VSGTITAPAGTNSAQVIIEFTCAGACGASKTVNYDDLSLVRSNAFLNPGFESDCAGVPCDWSASGSTLTRDTSNPHGGAASLRIDDATSPGFAVADCLTSFGNGSYAASFFYRTTSTNLTFVTLSANFFSGAGCVGGIGSKFVSDSPTNDGLWHQRSGSITAPAGTNSAKLIVQFNCTNGCGGSKTVNFDDVVLDGSGSPTAVTLRGFSARRSGQAVALRWSTGAEARTLGFEVRRGSARVGRLIPARGVGGSSYRLLDHAASRGRSYVYRLEAVGLDGSRRLLGTARLSR